jgi:glycosyltransferase involved in cell wall biosynthesis
MARTPATVICVTPVRNEAWILERFLRGASVWADHIVVADQGSTDGSREILARFDKVRLVDNPNPGYDEGARQRLLLAEARRIPGRRLIVALDADEALSAAPHETGEWETLIHAREGTVARFDWVNILPGFERCWIPRERVPFAFVDDGSSHGGHRIHSTRVPVGPSSAVVELEDVKVLHLQHVARRRMEGKQRWYQCWEALNHGDKRPIQIYRQYHRMDSFPADELHSVDERWLADYDLHSLPDDGGHWDAEVLAWLEQHGPDPFRRLAIWDVDWQEAARRAGREVPTELLRDPRGPVDRAVHAWLRRTQPRAGSPAVRLGQRALIPLGW